jgi:hypothetical protein
MNLDESRENNADGKSRKPLYTLVVVSLIAAFVFAALPLGSAFAAPTGPGSNGNNNSDSWNNKVQKLQGEISIAQNLQTKPGIFCASSDQARYRDQYITTLRAAQALMVTGGKTIPVTGNSANGTSANGNGIGNYYANHPDKLLASYLHQLRQLRAKMNSGSDRNGNSSNVNSASCVTTGTTTGTGTGTGTGTATGTGTGTGSATSTPAPSTTPTATP